MRFWQMRQRLPFRFLSKSPKRRTIFAFNPFLEGSCLIENVPRPEARNAFRFNGLKMLLERFGVLGDASRSFSFPGVSWAPNRAILRAWSSRVFSCALSFFSFRRKKMLLYELFIEIEVRGLSLARYPSILGMLWSIVAEVATLTHGLEIVRGTVLGLAIQMGGGENHLSLCEDGRRPVNLNASPFRMETAFSRAFATSARALSNTKTDLLPVLWVAGLLAFTDRHYRFRSFLMFSGNGASSLFGSKTSRQ